MILVSADTAFFFEDSGQDAIMGCENCGRRVETAHASISASDRILCDRCHWLWMEGYYTGREDEKMVMRE